MNKVELAEAIASKVGSPRKHIEDVLGAFEDVVISQLKASGEVTLTGFGTFSARRRAARMGVNPQKPTERIHIPEVIVPKFKAGKTLKDSLKA